MERVKLSRRDFLLAGSGFLIAACRPDTNTPVRVIRVINEMVEAPRNIFDLSHVTDIRTFLQEHPTDRLTFDSAMLDYNDGVTSLCGRVGNDTICAVIPSDLTDYNIKVGKNAQDPVSHLQDLWNKSQTLPRPPR